MKARKGRGMEKRLETRDAVAYELECSRPSLLPLFRSNWHRVPSKHPKLSPLEWFIQWADADPDMAVEARQKDADRYVAELAKQQWAMA